MKPSMVLFLSLVALMDWSLYVHGELNYSDALSKSLMFLEAQRSGKLPRKQRITWRGDSGLTDGRLQNVDLVGGYYDAGDNVKYGFPMGFTITVLAWGAMQYERELKAAGEIAHVRDAIKWGTNYFLKVGDPLADHNCWERPENMDTPRTVYKIDGQNPGTEIAAETAAALAASSIVFRGVDNRYSRRLLGRAQLLFAFADAKRGTYKGECPFYCSYSGYKDELLWAASWLYLATKSTIYSEYIHRNTENVSVNEFSWDLKYAGIQVLLSNLYFEGDYQFAGYKSQAESFVCSILPRSPSSSVFRTPGGLLYVREGANTQYVTSAAFLLAIYSDLLSAKKQTLSCGGYDFKSSDLMSFAKQQVCNPRYLTNTFPHIGYIEMGEQYAPSSAAINAEMDVSLAVGSQMVDYLLGKNPLGMSYMVGFGNKYPNQAHHRGASIDMHYSSKSTSTSSPVPLCVEGFMQWYSRDAPNPNLLVGAVVGGPDRYDRFEDCRSDSTKLEPATYINTPLVGVLAKLRDMSCKANKQC